MERSNGYKQLSKPELKSNQITMLLKKFDINKDNIIEIISGKMCGSCGCKDICTKSYKTIKKCLSEACLKKRSKTT